MRDPIAHFEWGSVEGGFALIEGVHDTGHPRRARAGAGFVSSHGAIVEGDQKIPFGEPFACLVPAQPEERRVAEPMSGTLLAAGERQFALAELAYRRYRLFRDHSGLFRAFAMLRTSKDILAFANRYGPLGADASIAVTETVPGEPWKRGLHMVWAEPLTYWQRETAAMREVLAIWEGLRERRIGHVQGRAGGEERRLAARVSEGLRDRVDLVLEPTADGPALVIQPKGLIGALWWQAARAIAGNRELRPCAECGTWYEVSAGHARPDKLYCSDACRMRAYRRRKKGQGT